MLSLSMQIKSARGLASPCNGCYGAKRRNEIEENQCNQKYSPRCVHRAAEWRRKFYRG